MAVPEEGRSIGVEDYKSTQNTVSGAEYTGTARRIVGARTGDPRNAYPIPSTRTSVPWLVQGYKERLPPVAAKEAGITKWLKTKIIAAAHNWIKIPAALYHWLLPQHLSFSILADHLLWRIIFFFALWPIVKQHLPVLRVERA